MATETEPEPTIPLWRRLLVVLAWFSLALILVLVVLYWFVRQQATSRLDRVMKELDATDPTWRWDKMQAARPEFKPGENSAEVILRIVRRFPRGWPDYKLDEKLQNLQPNQALDAPRREVLQKLLSAPPVAQLRDEARTIVNFPRGRIDIVMAENPIMTLLPNHQEARQVAALLKYDIWDRVSRGKFDEAADSIESLLVLANVFDEDPFLIGQLIRMAIIAIGLSEIERTLGQGLLTDAKLAMLQKRLLHPMSSTRMETAMRGERWFVHGTLLCITEGKMTTKELAGLAGAGPGADNPVWNWFVSLGSREMARREHPSMLETMTRVVEAAKLPIKDQFAAEAAIDADIQSKGGPIMRMLLPATTKVNEAARRIVCATTAMHALLAVERYRLRHGKWPAKLDDCVPAFLDKVPLDPIDEAPLRYKIVPEGVVVYSLGNNRTDDGGDIERMQKDFGYRLWNPDQRGLAPPKLPPDPELHEVPGGPGVPGEPEPPGAPKE